MSVKKLKHDICRELEVCNKVRRSDKQKETVDEGTRPNVAHLSAGYATHQRNESKKP